MAKHILYTREDDIDFVVIGITSLEDQYFVVAQINSILKLNLVLRDYVPFNLKEGKLFRFSLYRFLDEELGLEYSFIPNASNIDPPRSNTTETGMFAGVDIDESLKLIKELPKTDYFIILKGEELHNYQFKIVEKLNQIPDFINVRAIEIDDLPSKRNLIF